MNGCFLPDPAEGAVQLKVAGIRQILGSDQQTLNPCLPPPIRFDL
jgi:hypothetical protein